MEDCSVSGRNKGLTQGTTWMNLEEIMLQEISQPQKASTVGAYSQEMSRRGKFRDRKLMNGCQGLVEGGE